MLGSTHSHGLGFTNVSDGHTTISRIRREREEKGTTFFMYLYAS